MKLIMAVSRDNIVARHEADRMTWTGPMDKKIFKLLTLVGSGESSVFVGRKTYDLLPPLPGRNVLPLSKGDNRCYDLVTAAARYPHAWLVGGQTVALEAVSLGLVTEFFLCRSPNLAHKGTPIDHRLANFGAVVETVDFGGVVVEVRR